MSVINVEHITKLYGDKYVLSDVTCSVDDGDKVGIIGVNGTGKSTLLKMIAGEEEPDTGEIIYSRGRTIGFLPQLPEYPKQGSVLEYICSDAEEHDYAFESEAKSMMNALELFDFDQPLSELSGGQKKRAALCRVLLEKTDILILDEPTNHLDNRMSEWLERFLIRYKGILIMITHDRYFLDRVSNRIWEIDKGSIYFYDTNYSGFLERKAQREEIEQASERKRQSILRTELKWVMRGARARSTKQKARLERYEILKNMDSPQGAKQVEMESIGVRMGKKTIELDHLSKAYGSKVLFSDFTYIFPKYSRIGIVGMNGCGKSTLLKIINGLLPADSGSVDWGDTVKLGYFAQDSEEMDERDRVIDYIRDKAEYIRTNTGLITASRMLERFLFTSDMQYTPIAKLSGGERRRLYLLGVLMTNPNVILLDEPTNDLDIATLQVLEEFLDYFNGIVITVSHDRYFLDRVADRIFSFEDGSIRVYEGGYTDYLEKRKEQAEDIADFVSEGMHAPKVSGGGNSDSTAISEGTEDDNTAGNRMGNHRGDGRTHAKKVRFTWAEEREFETIDDDIAALEERIEELDGKILKYATDFVKLAEFTAEKEQAENELAEKEERWLYLTEKAEEIEQARKK